MGLWKGKRILGNGASHLVRRRGGYVILGWLVVLLLGGCRLPTLLYFTAAMLGQDMRQPPEIDLLAYREKLNKSRSEPLRVAVVCYADIGTQIHLGPLPRELTDTLARELAKGLAEHKDRLVILAPSAVYQWQERQEQWSTLNPSDMARDLGADLVIFVELNRLSLYEGGS
ncbi:MAG: hypothetical protein NZM42_08155, partial [Gemmatales bacterium]|nr:hypothetical protein [Gemmatales bacterium]